MVRLLNKTPIVDRGMYVEIRSGWRRAIHHQFQILEQINWNLLRVYLGTEYNISNDQSCEGLRYILCTSGVGGEEAKRASEWERASSRQHFIIHWLYSCIYQRGGQARTYAHISKDGVRIRCSCWCVLSHKLICLYMIMYARWKTTYKQCEHNQRQNENTPDAKKHHKKQIRNNKAIFCGTYTREIWRTQYGGHDRHFHRCPTASSTKIW